MLQAAALLPLCHRGSPRVWALAEQLRSPKFSAANAFSRAWHNLPGRPTFLSFLNSALGSAEACTNPNGHTEARPVLRCNAKVKLGSQRVPKGPKGSQISQTMRASASLPTPLSAIRLRYKSSLPSWGDVGHASSWVEQAEILCELATMRHDLKVLSISMDKLLPYNYR